MIFPAVEKTRHGHSKRFAECAGTARFGIINLRHVGEGNG